MDEPDTVWTVAIGLGALLFGLWLGDEVRTARVEKDCKSFGAFRLSDRVYDCRERVAK